MLTEIFEKLSRWWDLSVAPKGEDGGDRLEVNDGIISKRVISEEREQIAICEIDMAVMMTCSTGALDLDPVWMLTRRGGGPAFSFAHNAVGASDIVEELTGLPNFAHHTMLEALASAEKERFILWHSCALTSH